MSVMAKRSISAFFNRRVRKEVSPGEPFFFQNFVFSAVEPGFRHPKMRGVDLETRIFRSQLKISKKCTAMDVNIRIIYILIGISNILYIPVHSGSFSTRK